MKKKLRILYLEDDWPVARYAMKALQSVASVELEFEHKTYEKDLVEYVNKHPKPALDVVLLDVMVAYQALNQSAPEPPEVESEGYLRAGIRVLLMLQGQAGYARIPVLLHSNLPDQTIRESLREKGVDDSTVSIISKGADHENVAKRLEELAKVKN